MSDHKQPRPHTREYNALHAACPRCGNDRVDMHHHGRLLRHGRHQPGQMRLRLGRRRA